MTRASTTRVRMAAGCAALLAAPALAVCSVSAAAAEPTPEPAPTASEEQGAAPEPSESAPTPSSASAPASAEPAPPQPAPAGTTSSQSTSGGWSWAPVPAASASAARPTSATADRSAAVVPQRQAIGGGTAALSALPGMVVTAPTPAPAVEAVVPLPEVAGAPGTVDAFDLTGQLLPVPAQLQPGDVVLVRAAGFQPGELLVVTHDEAVVPGPDAAVTDERGRVERRFEVPAAQISGTHTLVLRGRSSVAAWSYQVGVVRGVSLMSADPVGAEGPSSAVVPGLVGATLVAGGVALRSRVFATAGAAALPSADLPSGRVAGDPTASRALPVGSAWLRAAGGQVERTRDAIAARRAARRPRHAAPRVRVQPRHARA